VALSLTSLALKVLILAGGGTAKDNHHSHLVHVQQLQTLLASRGVPADAVTVFWADGQARTPDRAIIPEAPDPDDWLLGPGKLNTITEPGPKLLDTRLPGARPAKRLAIQEWLGEIGPTLRPDDTLLIAVTDHGEPDPNGGFDTRITLWNEAHWSSSEALQDLQAIPDDVRVLFWASQCHSGGFADLRRRPNTCGAFSTTPDRVAYGCDPNLAVRTDVGHFLRLSEGLARHGALGPANDEAMVFDDTPDVPHRTSDAFTWEVLTRAAEAAGAPLDTFMDDRLTEADPDAPEHALIAQICTQFGLGPLYGYGRTLALLDDLGQARYTAEAWRDIWAQTLNPVLEHLGERTLRTTPERRARPGRLKARAAARKALRRALDQKPEQALRLTHAHAQLRRADVLIDRLSVQEAAAYRVAYLQARLAVAPVLDHDARQHLSELRACETKPLWPATHPIAPRPLTATMGPTDALQAAVAPLRPGWFGVRYRDRRGGAAEITGFEPGSPLRAAGLHVGDVITAVGDWQLDRANALRMAAVQARPGAPIALSLRDGRKTRTVTVFTAPAPLPAPPPAIGQILPPLGLISHAPSDPLPPVGEGRPTVLFFWSTSCKPCKRALAPLQTWAEQNNAHVIAITREGPPTIERFLERAEKRKTPFPFAIARDPRGEAHRLLLTDDETPFFAYISADRRLVTWGRGFTDQIPLEIEPTAHPR
jgi:thiol-disulfide isomerase/thioredoxin